MGFNCFRHVNPDSFNYELTGWHKDVSTPTITQSLIAITNKGQYVKGSGPQDPGVIVSITGGGGSGATAIATLLETSTPTVYEVSSITVTDGGSGYTSQPVITFSVGTNTTELVAATAVVVPDKINGALFYQPTWVTCS